MMANATMGAQVIATLGAQVIAQVNKMNACVCM